MSKVKSQLNKAFLSSIQTLLKEQEVQLENELSEMTSTSATDTTNAHEGSMPDYGDKDDENALEVAEYTANEPIKISLEKTLRDVKKSLKRIDDGTYGICKYCDQPIDEKRLLARPTSSACISCKKTLTDEV